MQKKQSTDKKTTKQSKPAKTSLKDSIDKLNRAEKIGNVLGMLAHFTPINYDLAFDNKPMFSREFLLKKLLGLTDEEYEANEQMILHEQTELIKSMELANQVLNMREAEGATVVEEVKPKKKEKVKVN